MQQPWSSNIGLRKHAVAGAIAGALATLSAPLPAWAGAQPSASQAAPAALDEAIPGGGEASRARTCIYSVINLWRDASSVALLNERGQAAFGSIDGDGITNGFFDGDRVHDIGSLGGSFTWVHGLNKQGVVVGESEDAERFSNILAFAWTLSGGMRALPGTTVSFARDVNDRNQIVGQRPAPGVTARAVRWNPDGTVTPLGPLPLSLSEAFAINNQGLSTGFADVDGGAIHATLWDRAGNLTDLGTLGGSLAFGEYLSERNEVAGESVNAANDDVLGFFWSRDSGMVPINVGGGGSRLVSGLNNRGEVVGDTVAGERRLAYQWTMGRGVVRLPSGSAARSDVFDINNRSEMVGLLERSAGDGGGLRAVRWPGLTEPIDLNAHLYRPPAGLVLEAGVAINDDGVILAHSNAGLVMLRPGTRGTDAPVLGPLLGLPEVLEVGQDLALTVGFVDNAATQTHTASVTWTDQCASPAPTVSEAGGVGQVRLRHQFCAAGYYKVRAQVTDSGGRSTAVQRDIVVEAPGLASLSGKGVLAGGGASAVRGYRDLPLRFALWAPMTSGTPGKAAAGSAVVILSGPFYFRSDQVSTSASSGQQARIEGTGWLNGRAGYRFVLEAWDGGGKRDASPDRLRVRVTHTDAASGVEAVDYDNAAPAKARTAVAVDRTAVAEGGLRLRN
jgi:uncharacterized membrane protein